MDKLDNEIEKVLKSIPEVLHVSVTWGHINRSRNLLNDKCALRTISCPIALALQDMGYNVKVGSTQVDFFANQLSTFGRFSLAEDHRILPDLAACFIHAFDYNKEIVPIEFDLVKPKE